MKKTFKMENLDCANCAAKMEHAINKINGVNSAAVNFFAQKLIIDADDEHFDEILTLASAECKKVEKNCRIII